MEESGGVRWWSQEEESGGPVMAGRGTHRHTDTRRSHSCTRQLLEMPPWPGDGPVEMGRAYSRRPAAASSVFVGAGVWG